MKSRNCTRLLQAIVVGVAVVLSACTQRTPPSAALPSLHVEPARVDVAGISSGAYMATQLHLAYPEIFHGAAIVAGGPWDCAQGSIATAVTTCMKGVPAPDAEALAKVAQARAAKGEIGPLAKLAGEKVYVLHGKRDPVIAASVAKAAADFYGALKAADPALASLQVTYDGDRDFTHTWPTLDAGNACDTVAVPFIGKCGFDAAGAVFAALYGPPPHEPTNAVGGELRPFDQNGLRPDGKDAFLAEKGYVYIPPACQQGQACGVLVALHGCMQDSATVGEAFVRDAGFNRWADVYGVAVLYPQARISLPANPKGCWDWFGYTGANYATRDGVQLRWIVAALKALGLSSN
ncbi:MAG: hypothetical protein JSS28_06360 [Proteobacteria bacterium]|nr:hypothetical protein [Pseudomonadota bacterium]